ncbi:L,D-transpeptidase family protein [Salinisphaera dokdonensis]|uniref:L,D-transpeptidase family protein n=1 Tax=Salinisphaera dokdonensis TaxID=454598 RepID=UPI003341CC79
MRPKRIGYRALVTLWLLTTLALAAPAIAQESVGDTASQAPVDLVVVMKANRVLYLYSDGEMVDQFPIALGKDPIGTKRRRGDNKTPEGLYRLDWRNPNSDFYRSLHVSYPDAQDRAASARLGVDPGDFIMIHGQPSYDDREREGDWTNGCIAVSNAAIDEIWNRVSDGTRIHIYP